MWKQMGRRGRLLVVALVIIVAAWPSQAAEIGEPLQFRSIQAHDGQDLTTKRLRRKVTVIALWASWCTICKQQLAELEAAFARVADHQDLQIAFVSLDRNPDQALSFYREHTQAESSVRYLYHDPSLAMAEALEARDFPFAVIIDRQGKVGYVQTGYEPGRGQAATLVAEAEQYLAQH